MEWLKIDMHHDWDGLWQVSWSRSVTIDQRNYSPLKLEVKYDNGSPLLFTRWWWSMTMNHCCCSPADGEVWQWITAAVHQLIVKYDNESLLLFTSQPKLKGDAWFHVSWLLCVLTICQLYLVDRSAECPNNMPAVSHGQICLENFTCCHTETEVAEQNLPSHPFTVSWHRAYQSQHLVGSPLEYQFSSLVWRPVFQFRPPLLDADILLAPRPQRQTSWLVHHWSRHLNSQVIKVVINEVDYQCKLLVAS